MSDTTNSARAQILNGIRRSLRRGELGGQQRQAVEQRLATPERGPIVARAQLPQAEKVALFCQWAEVNNATVARVEPRDVPAEVASYLARNNLPAEAAVAPSPLLGGYDWESQKLLVLRRGRAEGSDQVSITGAFAGIAETGTLVMASGPDHPVSLNLLPDTHIVVLRESDVVSGYEEVWAKLRDRYGKNNMPRTVNTITGPSRTGDIEQAMELGAHGPRRLHILVVRD
ncbi:L-lactate dehydrogenase complex protein LldG [Enhydrobacter aerosaccus]|uniref:L-lactate dehydrogenase complex protein LldG n=1 Tax=Enhydrobacter aerosaccus TaxID=225324 RepID=A0A1T4QQN7_9HYPH|nr:lactate utilization protein [Enhydrobacter aerosaccus]SKA05791.1 L-lactate dehydrogenase complex protein LldG [Enhydrobacter aerosaccus]